LPGGFEPVLGANPVPVASGARGWVNPLGGGGTWLPEFADIREERVVLYGTAGSGMGEVTYPIRATHLGRLVLPPASGESLYERTIQARSLPGRITVERPSK